MALYRGQAEGTTLLAVSNPLRNATVKGETLCVVWSTIGTPVNHFTLAMDQHTILEHATGNTAEITLDHLVPGPHVLTVTAEGATTRYPLSWLELDTHLDVPIPVSVDVPFTLEK